MGTLFTSAALIGFLTACWDKIKGFLSRLWSIAIVEVSIEGSLSTAMKAYCWSHLKRSPFGAKRYICDKQWVRPENKLLQVAYEALGTDPICFWNGWKPLFLGAVPDVSSNGKTVGTNSQASTITFIRGTFNLDQLIITATDHFNDKFMGMENDKTRPNRFHVRRFVGRGNPRNRTTSEGGVPVSGKEISHQIMVDTGEFRFLKWKFSDLGPEISVGKTALSALALPQSALEAFEEAKHWLVSEKWYRERQIPWTRGWLLYGPPGTGKSSFIRGIAEDLGLPIYIFDLSSMSNFEFQEFWQEMRSNVPCVAAFEDVDAVFEGRKNVCGEQGGGLTFDAFLNALSGIEGANGILKVLTTNRIDVLDDALGVPRKDATGVSLSTRPGRADRAIELAHPDEDGRRKIAARILCDHPFHIEQLVKDGAEDTGAQFTDRCARIALVEYWKEREGKPCNEFSDSGRVLDAVEDIKKQLSAVAKDPNLTIATKSSFRPFNPYNGINGEPVYKNGANYES